MEKGCRDATSARVWRRNGSSTFDTNCIYLFKDFQLEGACFNANTDFDSKPIFAASQLKVIDDHFRLLSESFFPISTIPTTFQS